MKLVSSYEAIEKELRDTVMGAMEKESGFERVGSKQKRGMNDV